MKLRNMLFLSAFLLAIGANFAFTVKNQYPSDGYFYTKYGACTWGVLEQDNCTPIGAGEMCTIYDYTRYNYVQAYEDYESFAECEAPLYQQN
jgi:hypothetical protein